MIPSGLHSQQRKMKDLVRRARDIDLWTFEGEDRDTLTRELQPRVSSIVHEACVLTSSLLPQEEQEQEFDADAFSPPTGVFEMTLDAAIRNDDTTTAEKRTTDEVISDVAFIATVELRQRESRLSALSSMHTTPVVLAECDSALRRVTKALCAIDRAIAVSTSTEAHLEYLSELDLSLRVRQCYAQFRSRVVARASQFPNDTSADDIYGRLIGTGHEIAVIVGLPVYPLLRLNDRMQLRGLQQRTLAWLKSSPRDPGDGLRLWQDILATIAMFLHVNRRQELVEHDNDIVKMTLAELTALTGGDSSPTATTWTMLAPLMGRDAELDVALEQHRRGVWPTMMLGRLMAVLTRLEPDSSVPLDEEPATNSPRAA